MSAEIENISPPKPEIVQASIKWCGEKKSLDFIPMGDKLVEKVDYPPCELLFSTGAICDLADPDETKSKENTIKMLFSLRQNIVQLPRIWETSGHILFETHTTRGVKHFLAIPNLKTRSGPSLWIIGGLIPKNQTAN